MFSCVFSLFYLFSRLSVEHLILNSLVGQYTYTCMIIAEMINVSGRHREYIVNTDKGVCVHVLCASCGVRFLCINMVVLL